MIIIGNSINDSRKRKQPSGKVEEITTHPTRHSISTSSTIKKKRRSTNSTPPKRFSHQVTLLSKDQLEAQQAQLDADRRKLEKDRSKLRKQQENQSFALQAVLGTLEADINATYATQQIVYNRISNLSQLTESEKQVAYLKAQEIHANKERQRQDRIRFELNAAAARDNSVPGLRSFIPPPQQEPDFPPTFNHPIRPTVNPFPPLPNPYPRDRNFFGNSDPFSSPPRPTIPPPSQIDSPVIDPYDQPSAQSSPVYSQQFHGESVANIFPTSFATPTRQTQTSTPSVNSNPSPPNPSPQIDPANQLTDKAKKALEILQRQREKRSKRQKRKRNENHGTAISYIPVIAKLQEVLKANAHLPDTVTRTIQAEIETKQDFVNRKHRRKSKKIREQKKEQKEKEQKEKEQKEKERERDDSDEDPQLIIDDSM